MSLQTRLLSLVDVLLRVPPLFIIDELFRMGLGLPQGHSLPSNYEKSNETIHIVDIDGELVTETGSPIFQYDAQFYKLFFMVLLKFIFSCVGK